MSFPQRVPVPTAADIARADDRRIAALRRGLVISLVGALVVAGSMFVLPVSIGRLLDGVTAITLAMVALGALVLAVGVLLVIGGLRLQRRARAATFTAAAGAPTAPDAPQLQPNPMPRSSMVGMYPGSF
jgi:predicted phage tail protein